MISYRHIESDNKDIKLIKKVIKKDKKVIDKVSEKKYNNIIKSDNQITQKRYLMEVLRWIVKKV
nr:MAG TPA: hypothetical protein [Herelleviridae sp.]